MPRRAALWIFEEAASIRHKLIERAGRLTRPHGRLRLTLSGGEGSLDDWRGRLLIPAERRELIMRVLRDGRFAAVADIARRSASMESRRSNSSMKR